MKKFPLDLRINCASSDITSESISFRLLSVTCSSAAWAKLCGMARAEELFRRGKLHASTDDNGCAIVSTRLNARPKTNTNIVSVLLFFMSSCIHRRALAFIMTQFMNATSRQLWQRQIEEKLAALLAIVCAQHASARRKKNVKQLLLKSLLLMCDVGRQTSGIRVSFAARARQLMHKISVNLYVYRVKCVCAHCEKLFHFACRCILFGLLPTCHFACLQVDFSNLFATQCMPCPKAGRICGFCSALFFRQTFQVRIRHNRAYCSGRSAYSTVWRPENVVNINHVDVGLKWQKSGLIRSAKPSKSSGVADDFNMQSSTILIRHHWLDPFVAEQKKGKLFTWMKTTFLAL